MSASLLTLSYFEPSFEEMLGSHSSGSKPSQSTTSNQVKPKTTLESIQTRYGTLLEQKRRDYEAYRKFYELDSYKFDFKDNRDLWAVINAKKAPTYVKPYKYNDSLELSRENVEEGIYTLQTFLVAEKQLQENYIPEAEKYYAAQRLHNIANFSLHTQGMFNDAILQTQRRIISLLINIKELKLLKRNTSNFQTSIDLCFDHILGVSEFKITEYATLVKMFENNLDVWNFTYSLPIRDDEIKEEAQRCLGELEKLKGLNTALINSTTPLKDEFFEMLDAAQDEMGDDLKGLANELKTCINDLTTFVDQLAQTIENEEIRTQELQSRWELLQEYKAWLSYVRKDFDYIFEKHPFIFDFILFSRTSLAAGWSHFSSMYPKRKDSRLKRRL